ncbi:hypothetical protein REPUB_Repub06bG0070700 [Reevesia pubescens]
MVEGIEDLRNKLTLTDEEQNEILVEKNWYVDTMEEVKNCLVVKSLTNKVVNVDALRSVFSKKFDSFERVDKIKMEWCGVEKVDTKGDNMAWGYFLRVQVNIKVTKPLKRGTRVSNGKGNKLRADLGKVWESNKSRLHGRSGDDQFPSSESSGGRSVSQSRTKIDYKERDLSTQKANKVQEQTGKIVDNPLIVMHEGGHLTDHVTSELRHVILALNGEQSRLTSMHGDRVSVPTTYREQEGSKKALTTTLKSLVEVLIFKATGLVGTSNTGKGRESHARVVDIGARR